MKIRVRLYGTLRDRMPASDMSEGMEIELPEGGTARDLLSLLGLAESRGVVAVAEGKALDPEDPLKAEAVVSVFQAISGG